MAQRLPLEILIQVVSYLDAPAAVCFALTSSQLYNAVLLAYEVSRLEDVCPRDVRSLLPEALATQAYNILTFHKTEAFQSLGMPNRRNWSIDNFHDVPVCASNLLPAGYASTDTLLLVEHLAYIRQAIWDHPALRHAKVVELGDGLVVQCPGNIRVPVPTEECNAYLQHQLQTSWQLEYRMVLLIYTWDQEMIESVEFMVLRERLGAEWMNKVSTPVLKSRSRRWRDFRSSLSTWASFGGKA